MNKNSLLKYRFQCVVAFVKWRWKVYYTRLYDLRINLLITVCVYADSKNLFLFRFLFIEKSDHIMMNDTISSSVFHPKAFFFFSN